MSKVAVVFWSGTGNTETMATAVETGAKNAGAEVSVINASSFQQIRLQIMMGSRLDARPWGLRCWKKANLSPCLRL